MRCTILNLSCGGALVTAHGEPGLLRGLVELELRLPYAEPRLCRWRGYVKHQGPGGIGIMFDDLHLPELLPLLGVEKTMRRLRRQQAAAQIL